LWLLGLLGAIPSCGAPGEPAQGTVAVNLVGQAPSGAVYRLRHAVITVTGPDLTRIWNTDDDPDRTSLSANVLAGEYSASVAPGWQLERIEGMSATPVVAQLVSDNPVSFLVSPQARTTVPLRFHVDTDVVDLSQGYDIVITVEESSSPQIIVVTNVNNFQSGSITVHAGNANGDVAPLRTIEGPLTTLLFPGGVTVTDDEIVVCDAGIGAIDFFPINASGNVAPTRQIVGLDSGVAGCVDVAVYNGDVYVAQLDDILVFPITANGDATPTHRISGFSLGEFFAIDRGELYMTDWNAGEVEVFSLPLTDDAAPTRSISSRCPLGITTGDGELFVSDGCAFFGAINVYPETASGEVTPLRTLGGDLTGMEAPEQIKRFKGQLYMADIDVDRVFIYADTAAGNVPPVRSIGGSHTGIVTPIGIAVH
jgi:hypothetical protein